MVRALAVVGVLLAALASTPGCNSSSVAPAKAAAISAGPAVAASPAGTATGRGTSGPSAEPAPRRSPHDGGRVAVTSPAEPVGPSGVAIRNGEAETVTRAFAFPTGDRETSVVLLEKSFPRQARLGRPYRYELKVTNLTDAPLTAVVVRERLAEAFRQPTTGPSSAAVPSSPAADPPLPPSPRDVGGQPVNGAVEYTIGDLAAHQVRTVSIVGVADRLGPMASQTTVRYSPLLSAGAEIINPVLKINKELPARVDLCQEILGRYVVANIGTGTETGVRIDETLPEGITTADGKPAVLLNAGELAEGKSREFTVRLKAAHVGRFASRAAAHGAGSEARSDEVTMLVQAPKLTVALAGPESEYVGKAAGYDLVVTNIGDAPARETTIEMGADSGAELMFVAGLQPDAEKPRGGGAGVRTGESAPPTNPSLGTIEAGGARKVRIAFRPTRGGAMNVSVTAKSVCAAAVSARFHTTVLTTPALLLEVRDREDPVRVGESAIYTIKVTNTGSGADKNIRIVAMLPGQLTLIRTSGPTDAHSDAQRLDFAPLESLAAGESATWTVEAKATEAGDVRFKVEMTSESLKEPAIGAEPTKLY